MVGILILAMLFLRILKCIFFTLATYHLSPFLASHPCTSRTIFCCRLQALSCMQETQQRAACSQKLIAVANVQGCDARKASQHYFCPVHKIKKRKLLPVSFKYCVLLSYYFLSVVAALFAVWLHSRLMADFSILM